MFNAIKSYNLEDELENVLRALDSPIVLKEDEKVDLKKIELERAGMLAAFCRGILCGIRVGKNANG